jgi:hypothetical protein
MNDVAINAWHLKIEKQSHQSQLVCEYVCVWKISNISYNNKKRRKKETNKQTNWMDRKIESRRDKESLGKPGAYVFHLFTFYLVLCLLWMCCHQSEVIGTL